MALALPQPRRRRPAAALLAAAAAVRPAVAAEGPWGCTEWRADGGQDRYVYDHFFSHLQTDGQGRTPFFVEAGANDGLESSNSAALERCFGWDGLLVEPDSRAFARLARRRPRSRRLHGCLAAREEERTLLMSEMSALSTTQEGGASPLAVIRDIEGHTEELKSTRVQCYPLRTLLKKFDVKAVDFLSLDVEGGELEALEGVDWQGGPPIHLISVETKLEMFGVERQRAVRNFLEDRGYTFLQRLRDDDIFCQTHGPGCAAGNLELAAPAGPAAGAQAAAPSEAFLIEALNAVFAAAQVKGGKAPFEAAAAAARGRPPPPGRRTVLVLGSSVAAGSAASFGYSWAALLAAALRPRGFEVDNQAMGGTTVRDWKNLLDELEFLGPALARAGVVILSLSLANEGLAGTWSQSDAEEIEEEYTSGLHDIALRLRASSGARLVFGGPYPNDEYGEAHLEVLQRVLAAMRTWEELDYVVDFLAAGVHGGSGRWGEGLASDAGHPNSRGHEAMFRCFDVDRVLGS